MAKTTYNICLTDTILMVFAVFMLTCILGLTYETEIPATFDADSALEAGKAYANYVVHNIKE